MLVGSCVGYKAKDAIAGIDFFCQGSLFFLHTEGCQLTSICNVWLAAVEKQTLHCSAFSGREHCCLIRAEICCWTLYEEVCIFILAHQWLAVPCHRAWSVLEDLSDKHAKLTAAFWNLCFFTSVYIHSASCNGGLLWAVLGCLNIHDPDSQNLIAADLVNTTGTLSFLLWKSYSLVSAC